MQLITTNTALRSNLSRLIKKYSNISFAVAWASSGTDVFTKLLEDKDKIRQAVIGTHFYQTHPDVLDSFADSQIVKFMLQPSGVFHPKVYAFWNDTSFEVLIGSANLTKGALNTNAEVSTLITHEDSPAIKDELLKVIEGYWIAAKTVDQDAAQRYRNIWTAKQPELLKLVDQYGSAPPTKSAMQSKVMGMDWPTFLAEIQKDKTHGFDDRLDLLAQVRKAFSSYPTFNDIPLDMRLGIAGLRSKSLKHSEWFGSMVGAGVFYKLMNASEPAFSRALDFIPPTGTVTKDQYQAFITEYLKAFPDGRDGLGTSTRLLSMKRPDQFLCVDGANLRKLANDVEIRRADKLDYDRYWDEVVVRLMDSPWWKSEPPKAGKELEAWKARASMLDAIFYEPTK